MHRLAEYGVDNQWRGDLGLASVKGFSRNALCGDEICVNVCLDGLSIYAIRFYGQGCMVSQACASMLCEGVEGKSVDEVLKATPEELMDFEIRELTMNRQRCALIAYEALMNALADYRVDNRDEKSGENDGRCS